MRKLLSFFLLLFSANAVYAADYIDKKEAETGKMSKCEVVNGSNFSGGKAVRITDEKASLTVSLSVTERKRYKVFVAGSGIGGEKYVNCSVDGNKSQFKVNGYKEVEVGTFILNEGANDIIIMPSWTWFDIDYVCVREDDVHIEFNIADAPVDANATAAAREMYTFLHENFGTKTVSGMMTGEMLFGTTDICKHKDMQAVYNASGKYPALVGFDFMNTTGKSENDSWMKDYSNTAFTLAKDTYRKGGLPAFTWHWRDPSRATDAFYSDQSSVKISSALNSDGSWNTSSSLYKNIIKDIDKIADHFLQMQDEGMACLFRPLHEADGKWFWWGREGAENFRKLYQLVYNEMVNVKGVHNVLWIWNASPDNPEWNPGNEFYDIVSADIYNDAYDYSSCYPSFDKLKVITEGKKIITLSENGPIPDIQREVDDEAVWSWWMPWYNTWNGGFVYKTSNAEWKACMTDSRVITLEDLSGGWGSETSISNCDADAISAKAVYNLSGQKVKSATQPGIYIVNGKKVLQF